MREPFRNVILACLIALLHLVMPAQAELQTEAEQSLLLAANHQGDFDVVSVNRLMRAEKGVNLRSGPGTHHDKVGLLQVGEVVWVTGETGNWLRILTRTGRIAFVYAPLLADFPRPATANEFRPVRNVFQAHRAVWRIYNAKDEGTAVAIGPRDAITALHVLLGLLDGGEDLGTVRLVQEGNPVELRVNRVLAVNVAHDLAYLETRERVAAYLDPIYKEELPPEAYEGTDHLGDDLFLVGYLDESLVRQETSKGIVYEDLHSYAFATDYPDLHGMSGSPMVNPQGAICRGCSLRSEQRRFRNEDRLRGSVAVRGKWREVH